MVSHVGWYGGEGTDQRCRLVDVMIGPTSGVGW